MVAININFNNLNMIKKLVLVFGILLSLNSVAQEQKNVDNKVNKKFLVSLHYNANLKNENVISENYNGLVGLDAKYVFYRNESIAVQGGIGLDYFTGKKNNQNLDYKNTIIVNPNVGIEFSVGKHFKPFFNLGLSVFTTRAKILNNNPLNQFDPLFNPTNAEMKFNYNSVSINPGFRVFFDSTVYFQADYKYLPIATNVNVHFIGVGLGINL